MKQQRDFYEAEAKRIIQFARATCDPPLQFDELFERMKEHGWTASEAQVLITKVNRGRFSFAFALQLLAAMGVKSIDIPRYEPGRTRTGLDPKLARSLASGKRMKTAKP